MLFAKLQKTLIKISLFFNKLSLARKVHITGQERNRRCKMKDRMAKKATYIGAGVGLVLFAIFGLLPGSFLGGVMGLNIAQLLFGSPLTSGILQRLIVGASMLIGVMVAGVMFVVGASTLGWILGTLADAITAPKAGLKEEKKEI
jgi:hypothetical protein